MHIRQYRLAGRDMLNPLKRLVEVRMRWVRCISQGINDKRINALQRIKCLGGKSVNVIAVGEIAHPEAQTSSSWRSRMDG